MLPRISLLDELRKGGYEASLITTFNAYLPFYEEVVLRRLLSAGVRHNVLLMDARQYAASLHNHPPQLAGRRYSLIPMQVPGAFHPKLIFLIGKHKGLVVVGSHNMTLAGFGFNRELTNVVRIGGSSDLEGISIAREVWSEIEHWLESYGRGIPDQIKAMVHRVSDFGPWMKTDPTPSPDVRLIAGRPDGVPLWEQLLSLIEGQTEEVCLGGAFFDQKLRFLKRVMRDLQPDSFSVGFDPQTVQIPSEAKFVEDIAFVRADRMGLEEEDDSGGYLHAKSLFIRLRNGEKLFASGSANPSAPAWMATQQSGNIEMMLALRGEHAHQVSETIGIAQMAQMPDMDDAHWQMVEQNQGWELEIQLPKHKIGLAAVENNSVLIELGLLDGLNKPEFALYTITGDEICRSSSTHITRELCAINFGEDELSRAFSLHCFEEGRLSFELLLHHTRALEEQARTGVQRRFKEALLSLETETPNIELLIQCIEKIVFSEDHAAVTSILGKKRSGTKQATVESKELGSLVIDVSEIKNRKSKQRLNHSGDFAYMLDALIYHLRLQEGKSIEELDRYGRSEEEQVGADDEEESGDLQSLADEHDELLKLCHSKVNTVVNRIIAQLGAFEVGKQSLNHIIIRLLGVLAVLRELRGCDGRVAWVEKGKTTVPLEQRERLLQEVMLTLFEGKSSLLHLESLGEDFEHSDDVARLKGLVLWLAWECGLTLDLQKPFMESPRQSIERLRRNAMVLALAQMIRADEVVIDEARQSIGSLTSSEMDWLKEILRVADQCETAKQGDVILGTPEDAEPGDIAIHNKLKKWDLRIVASCDGRYISLIKLNKENDYFTYTPEYLSVAKFTSRYLS